MTTQAASPEEPMRLSHIGRSLLFALGDDYYRVELSRLKGVVAWAALQPSEDRGVLGWLNLRGDNIPVVDLNQVVRGEPTERVLGARILLLECHSKGRMRTVGAIASEVFAMAREENSRFAEQFNPCDVLSSILLGIAS
jgi:chemotaxis signal transduction protein